MNKVAAVISLGILIGTAAEAATIRVPADASSIQQAIDAAVAGDVVSVAPGTYSERITFLGKAITVESEQGPLATVIDGGRGSSVVTFVAGETRAAVLRGFTIQNGATSFSGGGILIQNSSPSILGNWIVLTAVVPAPASTASSGRRSSRATASPGMADLHDHYRVSRRVWQFVDQSCGRDGSTLKPPPANLIPFDDAVRLADR